MASSNNNTPLATSSRARSRAASRAVSRPVTSFEETNNICAIAENRVKDIGIATINDRYPELILSNFADSHCYVNTLTKMHFYDPKTILLPRTMQNGELHELLENLLPDANILFIGRQYFNETKGSLMLKQLAVKGSHVPTDSTMYLPVACAAALIKYVEFNQNMTFAPQALQLSVCGSEGCMLIDSSSISNLEIIANRKDQKSKESLFGVINYTHTQVGARLLRIALCQPPADEATINTRLDCVEEFIRNESMYFAIIAALPQLSNADRLVGQLVKLPKGEVTIKKCQQDIANVVKLKQTLEIIPQLENGLQHCENYLLLKLRDHFQDKRISIMKEEIERIINSDVGTKKSVLQQRIQQCFAVKVGINGLLDVARKTFSEGIEDLHALVSSYQNYYNQPQISLTYSAKRGYYMQAPSNSPILEHAIQVVVKKKLVLFSTEEVLRLNERIKEAHGEIVILTHRVLEKLLSVIRENIACIYNLNDSIALLDMLTSFTTYVTLVDKCTRPEFTKAGPIAIKNGKHPIMQSKHSSAFIPNDTFISAEKSIQIITGPNMSGKSTYLKQVSLLVVLAHIGCFVPADFCSVRLTDRLFTRIGTHDSIEENASSFMLEMRETSYILNNITPTSFVVVDELGRGTSVNDGRAIAWSICEELQASGAYVLFVTHFLELTRLDSMYPNIVEAVDDRLVYNYRVGNGSSSIENYGIKVAAYAGMPIEVQQDALRFSNMLIAKQKQEKSTRESGVMRSEVELYSILCSLQNSSLPEVALRSFLADLRKSFFVEE